MSIGEEKPDDEPGAGNGMSDEDDRPAFKDWIPGAIRALRGSMTLREMSSQVRFSISYLSDIEQGRTTPTIETLDKIATACGVKLAIQFEQETDALDYVLIRRVDMETLMATVDRCRYVYAQITSLISSEYIPPVVLNEPDNQEQEAV